MNRVSLTIDSRPENVQLVGICSKQIASDLFSVAEVAEIEQAIVEAVNNCIEHAYFGNDEGQISIKFTLSKYSLLAEIIDQGKQFDPNCLTKLNDGYDYDPLDIDNLPEGGFGLKVIKSCMDEVNYCRKDAKNYWSLTKYRSLVD